MNDKLAHYGGDTPVEYTIEELLSARKATHGDFSDHARITQSIKDIMHSEPNWQKLANVQRESLEMIVHKIGRILAGNPNVADHWDDIAGYAKLVPPRMNAQ